MLTGNCGGWENIVTPDNVSNDTIEPKADLQSYTWEEIKTIARMNLNASELSSQYNINLGDTKEENEFIYHLVDLDGNNYYGFVFMYQTNLGHSHAFNDNESNLGGYANSKIANDVEGMYNELKTTAPELWESIKNVNVKCNDGKENSDGLHTYPCHIFLASANEVGFALTSYHYRYHDEGTIFDYFSEGNGASTRQARTNIGGTSFYWWLRSADYNRTTSFYQVSLSGYLNSENANSKYAITPCFVIG